MKERNAQKGGDSIVLFLLPYSLGLISFLFSLSIFLSFSFRYHPNKKTLTFLPPSLPPPLQFTKNKLHLTSMNLLQEIVVQNTLQLEDDDIKLVGNKSRRRNVVSACQRILMVSLSWIEKVPLVNASYIIPCDFDAFKAYPTCNYKHRRRP